MQYHLQKEWFHFKFISPFSWRPSNTSPYKMTRKLDFKVHHFHSGFPLPPRPLPDLSHLLKNYPKGQLSSVVKDVFCKGESNLYNDQFNIAKTEKWSKMSSKWWLHWKRRQEIIGIPELARFFQQVFFFLLFTLLGMPFQQFFSTTLFGWLFEIFFATILFQKLCCVKWIEIHKALKTNCWTSEFIQFFLDISKKLWA